MKDILYLLLAGGTGERLMPLTASIPKPLVRFGSQGCLIDYTLYNCLVSEGGDVLVLTQYMSDMVDNYIRAYWMAAFASSGRKLKAISSKRLNNSTYKGTADAVYRVLSSLERLPEHVVVLAGDHIYRMDYRQMVAFHLSGNNAATVGCIKCDPSQAHRFGIMNLDDDQFITGFVEKPNDPDIHKGRDYVLASMGIYIFNSAVLMEYLIQNQQEISHDFGHDVIPGMVRQRDVRAFHYGENSNSTPYWRDVGDLSAYWQAQMELIENDNDLLNFSPIAGLSQLPFSKKDIVWKYYNANHRVVRSSIANSAQIGRAVIKDSIVCPGVKIEDGVHIQNSVLLDGSVVSAGVDLSGRLVMPSVKVLSALRVVIQCSVPIIGFLSNFAAFLSW